MEEINAARMPLIGDIAPSFKIRKTTTAGSCGTAKEKMETKSEDQYCLD